MADGRQAGRVGRTNYEWQTKGSTIPGLAGVAGKAATYKTVEDVTSLGRVITGYNSWDKRTVWNKNKSQQDWALEALNQGRTAGHANSSYTPPKSTDTSYYRFYAAGNDIYGKKIDIRTVEATPEVKAKDPRVAKNPWKEFIISNKEGKEDLTVQEDEKPTELTAEDVLKRRLAMLKYRGRVSMPSEGPSQGNEPTLNISSSGTTGLNFA